MANERIVYKKKIYAGDDPNASTITDADGNTNESGYIEVERTIKMKVERGEGPSFQGTIYEFTWPDNEPTGFAEGQQGGPGDWGDTDRYFTIKKISGCKLAVIDGLTINRGESHQYQATKVKWDNTDQNEVRKTHTKRANGSGETDPFSGDAFNTAGGGDPSTDSGSSIDVEIIEEWTTERGLQQEYQKTLFVPTWHVDDPTGIAPGDDGSGNGPPPVGGEE